MRYYLSIILTLFACGFASSQSFFEKEGIVKVATNKEGVYKIDLSFIQSIGLDPASVDPHKIQIYGMPGGHVPQSNAVDYPFEPQALPLKVEANDNTTFDSDEVLFFYADAVQNIKYDFENETYFYSNNLYSDELYFFIDFNAATGKKIEIENSNESTVDNIINWYDGIYFHEVDETNLLSSGREWFGESFSVNKSQNFEFSLANNLAQSHELEVTTQYTGQTYSPANLNISINSYDLASVEIPTVSDFDIFPYRQRGEIINNQSTITSSLLTGKELNVQLRHEALGSGRSEGYLDYILVTAPERLSVNENQILVRNRGFQSAGNYQLKFSGLQSSHSVWDISNPLDYKEINTQDETFNFSQQEGQGERKFVVFNEATAFELTFVEALESQNLKSGNPSDYLIITYDDFLPAAKKLAQFRKSHNGYNVEVAKVSEIVNEFGSGRNDVSAIRNYIKYYYQLNPEKLKYVLMLGGSSYDYKDRVRNNTNLVPVYQSRNSLHRVFTYASDDFYGFMEEDEGIWEEDGANLDDLDLGIGRIPALSLKEASNAIDKIVHYESDPNVFDKWRNDLYFVADDEDGNIFHRDSERLSDYVIDNFGFYNIKKLYLGAYEQDALASSQRSPDMRNAITEMVAKGALIVNYIGHGSVRSWTNESILTKEMLSEWNNLDRLPLFVTATCEFGRFDNPNVVSGAQEMLLKPDGGAIALLTTSRPVESSSNATLNRSFFQNVFKGEGETSRKLGDIIKDTKNSGIVGVKNRNFILLGDPAVTLAEPQNNIKIEELVNENGNTDTLSGMSKITVSGVIENNQGQQITDFNGELTAELFDKPEQSSTIDPSQTKFDFLTYDQVLYRGRSTVENGSFELTFFVPKEINYRIGKGKFSLYAKQKGVLRDAAGFDDNYSIGGSSTMLNQDDIGPDINIFVNNREFRSGDKTGSSVNLIVDFFDEHGISISNSKVNPGLSMSLDGGEEIKLNDFFFYNRDSYQEGSLNYNISELPEGRHYITITALDVYNNKSKATIDFEVIGDDELAIFDFIMYPNPAEQEVNFRVRQNLRNKEVELSYHVLNNYGQLLYTYNYESKGDIKEDVWNLRDKNGVKLSPGIYFVRVILRSLEDNIKTDQIKKLIVIN